MKVASFTCFKGIIAFLLYGYGRIPHFELMAMELLGPSLASLCAASLPKKIRTTLLVAEKMVRCSLLRHDTKIHTFI